MKGKNGAHLTQGLFYEFNNPDAPYTLKSEDHVAGSGKEYVSIYKIYMDSVDEYDAAMQILGSMEHWRKLCALDWFMEGITQGSGTSTYKTAGLLQWREDMKARDASLAKKQLLQEAENGSVAAQRVIFDTSTKGKVSLKNKRTKAAPSPVSNLRERFDKIGN